MKSKASHTEPEIIDREDLEVSDGPDDEWLDGGTHKKSLSKLKDTDPDFYNFLLENDKNLLKFAESSDDDEADEGEDDGDEDNKVHKAPDTLEVGSDESDYENDFEVKRKSHNVVTLIMVRELRESLQTNPTAQSIAKAVDFFHAAICRVTEEESVYQVEASSVFNAVIELCVMNLQNALFEFLKLSNATLKHPDKSKKWTKVKGTMQAYFNDLFKLMNGVSSDHIISVMLKHLHSMCSILACYQKLSKSALKHLTKLWSSGEETVRVLAFLCILRLTTIQKSVLLNVALKYLYIAYIKESKFVSANTLPEINFMKQTLVDLFSLDASLSYQHAFLYIRQLAIHLRNAITIHKKENFQTVYNWQYMHSLRLWVDLISANPDSEVLRQLLYPLVQIILGCIKLIPTAQFVPLRFHCIQLLIKLGRETDTAIPVLPLITESLNFVDLSKPSKKASMKPFDFTFVLRLSKAAMTETGFLDAVIEYTFQLLLEYAASVSHKITFPDIFVPVVVQIKTFLKNCKAAKYSSKLRQALLKINETSKTIETARSKLNLNLNETQKIKAFEADLKIKPSPVAKYYEQVAKSKNAQYAKQATSNDKIASDKMPTITRVVKKTKKETPKNDGPVDLFPSDESDFEFPDVDQEKSPKDKKRPKDKQKAPRKKVKSEKRPDVLVESSSEASEQEDIVEDFDINNF